MAIPFRMLGLLPCLFSLSGLAYIGGKSAELDEAPGAVHLMIWGIDPEVPEPKEIVSNCTGTVIAKNWILTAAHCVAGLRIEKLYVLRNQEVIIPPLGSGKPMPGKRVAFHQPLIHPEFKDPEPGSPESPGPTEDFDITDVALIQLKSRISIAPAAVALTPAAPSQTVQVGGWGIPAESSDPLVKILFDGVDLAQAADHLRYGKRVVKKTSANMFTLNPLPTQMQVTYAPGFNEQFTRNGFSAKKARAEIENSHRFQHISMGDSGGPVYRKNDLGVHEVIGINSLENLPQDEKGIRLEYFSRVDAQSSAGKWLREVIKTFSRK